jgi:hypothetical protein
VAEIRIEIVIERITIAKIETGTVTEIEIEKTVTETEAGDGNRMAATVAAKVAVAAGRWRI